MIIYNYENNQVVAKTLSAENKTRVVEGIVAKWEAWAEPIKSLQKNHTTVSSRAKPKVCKADKKDWHSKIELNRVYEYYSKLYGLLHETFYDKISSYMKMGKERYDAVYNRAFNVDNKKTLMVALKDMLEYGEIVASAELKNTYEKKVLPIEMINAVDPSAIVSVKENSFIMREKTGEKISFVRINPCNFAYDPLVTPGTEEFDNCDKIVKEWKTKHEILSNKEYEISREELDLIVPEDETPNEKEHDTSDVDTVYRQNQVEVLNFYGNFTIEGKYYENYVAVVVGREKLVYFKPKGIYTPGIYYYPYHAIGNGSRGVSPLFYILDLCQAEEKTFNDSIDFIQLQKNPPLYAPEGFFEEEVTKMEPGKHILYTPGMKDPTAIIPIQFNAQPLTLFQEATKQLQKEIGGIDSGQLSVKSEALTEEEVRRIAQSENLIPNMIISGIMLHIVTKYLKDCVQILEGQEFDETIIKTAWEYANEQMQMQNVVGLLKEVGANDPSMVKLEDTAHKALESLGVNPADYLNDGRSQTILQNLAGLSDDVLQQLFQMGQQLQVEENNKLKAQKIMGNLQDEEYKRQLKEAWTTTGQLPEDVIVPNGQGRMIVPVEKVTPRTQTKNRSGVTVD